MAIKNLFSATDESFAVVSSKDECLAEDFTQEEYAEYLKDLDESKLRRKEGNEEPFTYFHLKLATKLEEALKGKDKIASMGMNKGGDTPIFTVMTNIVSQALHNITSGGVSVETAFKNGKPTDQLLLGLVRSMIISDLFAALQAREAGPLSGAALELTKKN
jgi:hypothetical protein